MPRSLPRSDRRHAQALMESEDFKWFCQRVKQRIASKHDRVLARLPETDYHYECGVIRGLKDTLELVDAEFEKAQAALDDDEEIEDE